jgi:chemotaxis protein methyltransferase CheR
MAKITAEEIKLLAKYIYNISGIYLDQNKGYLLETRLSPLLGSHNCSSFMDLYCRAKADVSRVFDKEVVNAISTNETLFFRDNKPFELLKNKIIPDLVDRRTAASGQGKAKLRIWSAACSTGQEVYSIAISLLEALGDLSDYDITLLGTDISDEAVAKASYGIYGNFEIDRGLPKNPLQRYFTAAAGGWRIKDEIRSLAVFKKFNLMDSYAGLGSFDIIFCRNVAIYFTENDKRKLFQKLGQVMNRDGCLIIGGSESLGGIAPQFQTQNYLRGVYYQLQGAAEAMAKARKPVPAARPAAKKAAAKTPERRKIPRSSSTGGERRPETLRPNSPPPTTPSSKVQRPTATEISAESGKIVETSMEIPEIPLDDSVDTAGGFLETAGSNEQFGESLLGNLPAASQSAEPLAIGRDAANGEEERTSLLQKIADRHQLGDDVPDRE